MTRTKRSSLLATAIALAISTVALAAEPDEQRVYVRFKSDTPIDKHLTSLAKSGGRTHYQFAELDAIVATLPAAVVQRLRGDPSVLSIETDPRRYPASLPLHGVDTSSVPGLADSIWQSSFEYSDIYAPMASPSQTTPYGITMVQAPQAWAVGADGDGVLICVIDSGLNATHEDFASGAITGGYASNWDADTCSHGTHVAGTTAAANNAIGVVGTAPEAKLYIIRVFAGGGDGCGYTYSSTVLDAAQRCAAAGTAQGRKVVINMSLAGGGFNSTENAGFAQLYSTGNVLSIAAAGNAGDTSLAYPASYDSVVSVAAVDSGKSLASFSQRNEQVEIAGPGVDTHSTLPFIDAAITVGSTQHTAEAMVGSVQAVVNGALANGSACTSVNGALAGKTVLCTRNGGLFSDKMTAVQDSGGVAAIIYNNVSGGFAGTLNGANSTIPVVSTSLEDGQELLAQIGQSATVTSLVVNPANGYGYKSGTSMATPHVAGVAAAVWSKHPNESNATIRTALTSTAEDLGSAGRDNSFGFGLVRALNAVSSIGDSTPPSAPAGLTATAPDAATVNLSWSASTDNEAVTGYAIERCSGAACSDFVEIGQASGTSFADSGLTQATTYRYRVRAFDAADNFSTYSSIATANTPSDTIAPSVPGGLSAGANNTGAVTLSWNASTDAGSGVAGYQIERCSGSTCSNFVEIAVATSTGYADSGLAASSIYRYRIRAFDNAGNRSGYSATVNVSTTVDTVAPSVPANLSASAVNPGAVNLSWTASTDSGSGVNGYKIERCSGSTCSNFAQVGSSSTPAFSDSGLNPSTAYRFRVRAYDYANNHSGYSAVAAVTTPADTVPPTAPSGLAGSAINPGQIDLSWTASTDTNGSGINGYKIERCSGSTCSNFAQVGSSSTTTFSGPGLSPSTAYRFRVRAYDRANNHSAYSAVAVVSTPADTIAPTAPTALTGTAINPGQIDLSWTASTDSNGSGINGYKIERCTGNGCSNFAQVGSSSTSGFSSTGLLPATAYRFRVRAYDLGNNHSAYSAVAAVSTPNDNVAPTAPTGLSGSAVNPGEIALSWTASTDSNGSGINGYKIERCTGNGCNNYAQVGSSSTTSFNNSGLNPSTAYNFRVRAYDMGNNHSGYSAVAAVSTPADNVAPTAPTGLSGSAVNPGEIALSWTASTDSNGSGINGYKIERCTGNGCNSYAQVGSSSTTSFNSSGLNPSTSYNFRVRAYDLGNNHSGYSAVAAVSTPADNVAPTAPTGLSGSAVNPGEIALSWTAATDTNGSGINGYKIERCTGNGCNSYVQVGSSSTTGFNNTGLSPSTSYNFRVRAYDLANNHSGYSAVAAVSTPADNVAPTAPSGLAGSAVNPGEIALSWTAATDTNGSGINGYKIERCTGNGCNSYVQVGSSSTTSFNSTGLSPSTSYNFRVRAYDLANNHSAYSAVAAVATPADNVAPTAPSGLSGSAVNPGEIALSWTAATDTNGSGINGYKIERCTGNGCNSYVQVGSSSTTSFNSSGLTPSTSYNFRVRAYDLANNHSAYSAVAAVATPADNVAPTAPSGLSGSAVNPGEIALSWTAATDTNGSGINGYKIERCTGNGCNSYVQVGSSSTTSFNSTGLSPSTSYNFRVRAYDLANNHSAYSAVAAVSTPADNVAPTAPSGLSGSAVNPGEIALSWTAATDTNGSGINGYKIERCTGNGCNSYVQVGSSSTTSFNSTGLSPSTAYNFRVRAYDLANNHSAYSAVAAVSTPSDNVAPTAPSGLTGNAVNPGEIALSWTAATDTNGSGINGYKIERCTGNGCNSYVQVGSSSTTSFNNTGLNPSTAYNFRVRAYDLANNHSAYSAVAAVSTPADNVAPTAPIGLTGSAVNPGEIALSWTAATDTNGSGINGYKIERCTGNGCNSYVQVGSSSTTSFNNTGLNPSTAYNFRVRAYDLANNHSAYSAVAAVSTPSDTVAPTAPTGLSGSAVNPGEIALSWTAATDTNGSGINGYKIERCTGNGCNSYVQVGSSSTTSFNNTGLNPSTAYNFRVRAYDLANNHSGYSAVAAVATPADNIAPTAPSNLSGSAVNPGEITLSWTAATDTDGSGINGYKIERCAGNGCNSFVQVGSSSTTDFSNAGLDPSTAYRYRVRAYDLANNHSAYSAVAAVSTPNDSIAPTAPGNLSGSAINPGRIDLSWTAATDTDGSGINGYKIERCTGNGCNSFVQVGSSSTTDFSNSGLDPSTAYRYRVRAYDRADNHSSYSAVAAVSTTADTIAPTAPSSLAAAAINPGRIDLSWTAATDTDGSGINGYKIERCTGNGCSGFVQVGSSSSTSFSNTGLDPSTTYRYRVRGYDRADNHSVYSAVAAAATPADTIAPTAPSGLTGNAVSSGQIDLSWTASTDTDGSGVNGYRIERCSGNGCNSFVQVGSASTTSYSSSGLDPLTVYRFRVRAYDRANNESAYSAVSSTTTPGT